MGSRHFLTLELNYGHHKELSSGETQLCIDIMACRVVEETKKELTLAFPTFQYTQHLAQQ